MTNKHTTAGSKAENETYQVKRYGDSSFVAKKIQQARETLQKFPVPEQYAK